MRYRVLGAVGASAAALAAAPATASACASFGSVKSFEGHARVAFSAQASGPNEPGQAQYGTESVTLKRDLSSLHINLNHKHATRLGILMFTGPASGGSVTIKDTFDDTRGNETAHGEVFYNGALKSGYPDHGSATLFVDPRSCKYQLSIAFGVKTHYTGDPDLNPGPNVGGGADGEREKIPHSLHLVGGAGPDAFHSGCQEALFTGTDCYSFGGGYSTDFMTLFDCHSAQAVNCSSGDKPVGSASFVWVLSAKFFKPKKI